jgi:hypothetical protein
MKTRFRARVQRAAPMIGREADRCAIVGKLFN